MKLLAVLAILFGISLIARPAAVVQNLPAVDQEKLRLAGIAADHFIERFNHTRDFRTVWKEFHMSDVSCTVQANGVISDEDYKLLRLKHELIERLYVSVMNYFYLRAVHDINVAQLNGDWSEDTLTPKEIRLAEKRSTYVKTNGKEPRSAKEVESMIFELNSFARLYRKHTPLRVMSSPAWRAKAAIFEKKNVPDSQRVLSGNATFCVPKTTKLYVVERGIFYFYFVEENRRMRVAALGIGN